MENIGIMKKVITKNLEYLSVLIHMHLDYAQSNTNTWESTILYLIVCNVTCIVCNCM